MLHHLGIVGQIRIDDETEIGQVDAARRHVGGDADPRMSIAQRLQRRRALVLGQLTRERDHGEAALQERALQMAHRMARVAEHDGARRFEKAQHVDDGVLDIVRGNPDGAIFDIGMAAFGAGDLDAEGLLLILLRQRDNAARQGRREQQGAAAVRRFLEDELHVLAEAHVEHLVGFVEHHDLQFGDVEAVAPQVIAQPSGRSDHDVGARGKLSLLLARIHAADTGDHARAGMLIEPRQFAMHLQGEFTGRRDNQRKRRGARLETVGVAQKIGRDRQPIGHGLAGPGLRRDQQVLAGGLVGEHRGLHRGGFMVVALRQGSRERRIGGLECHGMSDLGWQMAPETGENQNRTGRKRTPKVSGGRGGSADGAI